MNAEEAAGKVLDNLLRYIEQINSVETDEERDEVVGKLEDAIKALDGITFPDCHCGINEDMEYEIWKDQQVCGEA